MTYFSSKLYLLFSFFFVLFSFSINVIADTIQTTISPLVSAQITSRSMSMEEFEQGLGKLNTYLAKQLENKTLPQDNYFQYEYKITQKLLKNIPKSYDHFYQRIEQRIERIADLQNIYDKKFIVQAGQVIAAVKEPIPLLELFQSVLKDKQSSAAAKAEAEYQLGNLAKDNINFKQALLHLERAVKLDNTVVDYQVHLAELYLWIAADNKAKQTLIVAGRLAQQQQLDQWQQKIQQLQKQLIL